MNKAILKIIVFLCLIISANAQEIPDNVKTLLELNENIIKEYNSGDYKNALKIAEKSLALTREIFGENHSETALVYANIGEIYMARKKYDDAAENFKKSVSILEAVAGNNETNIIKHLSRLGTALALDGKQAEAAVVLEKSLQTAERKYGNESVEIIPYLETAADFYVLTDGPKKAEEMFIRLYLLNRKALGDKNEKLEEISDKFRCFSSRVYYSKENVADSEKFYDAVNTNQDEILQEGILNYTALSLSPPGYPSEAKRMRVGGVYGVKIEIDEKGKVTSARSICGGNKYLEEASEKAAAKVKFPPRIVNGLPRKVSGLLVYRYFPS